jgi:hypothetical protein
MTTRKRAKSRQVQRFVRHVCSEDKTCTCSIQALEPDEECPVHGAGPYPPRCGKCGRFIKRPNARPDAGREKGSP